MRKQETGITSGQRRDPNCNGCFCRLAFFLSHSPRPPYPAPPPATTTNHPFFYPHAPPSWRGIVGRGLRHWALSQRGAPWLPAEASLPGCGARSPSPGPSPHVVLPDELLRSHNELLLKIARRLDGFTEFQAGVENAQVLSCCLFQRELTSASGKQVAKEEKSQQSVDGTGSPHLAGDLISQCCGTRSPETCSLLGTRLLRPCHCSLDIF